eukprot:CAMPEP_0198136184 /NCGR_PEP_ID=MMETSP1442-20131203/60982_1 /TAXON_ID= /ORGANISM="Craspedostauros australis, Strain CCMP3328" /LENGTH=91 /DNA_ID=CAMNT_0043797391 /DNA_START=457 /DNA_END=729 /DNA_ORIENTATION=+
MDVSLIAAVGSFVVSERVLKPKATALFILGCVLAYDLKTKTHDPVSLRVYRGGCQSQSASFRTGFCDALLCVVAAMPTTSRLVQQQRLAEW